MRITRHRFARDIRQGLRPLHQLDNHHAPLAILEDYLMIGLAIGAPYWLAPWAPFWLTYTLLSLPIIGTRQRALATLLHESAHGALARSRAANFAYGTFFSGYLIFQSWNVYLHSHVYGHHAHFNDPEHDPDLRYLIEEGAYDEQSESRFVWRFLVAPLFLLKTPSKIVDLLKNRFFSRDEPRWEKMLKLTYLIVILAALSTAGFAWEVVLFWLIPYLTVFPLVNWYIELMEHYPLMGDGKEDVEMSRNRWTGPIAKFFTGIHHENYHQVHHLFMRIPFWNLPAANRILMQDPAYRATQNREIGFCLPRILGIPSILGGMTLFHKKPSVSSNTNA